MASARFKSHRPSPDRCLVIRILIVGDFDLVSHTLAPSLIHLGFDAAISSDWGTDELATALAEMRPSVVVLRATPDTVADRLSLVPVAIANGAAVLLLSEPIARRQRELATDAGVAALISTADPIDHVLDVIQFAHTLATTDEPATPGRSRVQSLRPRNRLDQLTAVEREVLGRLVDGHSPAQIAAERFVAVSTVRSQLKAIYRKLGVRSQVAAVALGRSIDARDSA